MYRNTTREINVGSTSERFRTEVDLKGLDCVRDGDQTGGAVRFGRNWILVALAGDKFFNIVRQQINQFVKL